MLVRTTFYYSNGAFAKRGRPHVLMSVNISDSAIYENGYLVSRGVRPLALVGTVETEPVTMLRMYDRLSSFSFGTSALAVPIPFVLPRNKLAEAGFASRGWIVDTLKWVLTNVPEPHQRRLIGLLLGYSEDAVAAHDEAMRGNPAITVSDALASS